MQIYILDIKMYVFFCCFREVHNVSFSDEIGIKKFEFWWWAKWWAVMSELLVSGGLCHPPSPSVATYNTDNYHMISIISFIIFSSMFLLPLL